MKLWTLALIGIGGYVLYRTLKPIEHTATKLPRPGIPLPILDKNDSKIPRANWIPIRQNEQFDISKYSMVNLDPNTRNYDPTSGLFWGPSTMMAGPTFLIPKGREPECPSGSIMTSKIIQSGPYAGAQYYTCQKARIALASQAGPHAA